MPSRPVLSKVLTLSLLLVPASALAGWPQLRGAHQGHANDDATLPTEWSEEQNVAWKTSLPGLGWSSPVLDDHEIWLTTALDEERSLRAICLDRHTGAIKRDIEVFRPAELVVKHERNSHATPTPVLTDDTVFVHFGTYGTAAIDRPTGEILWKNQENVLEHQWGPGSSPILHDGLLVFHCDGMVLRYVVALDSVTGKQAWKAERRIEINKGGHFRKAFSTPLVAEVRGQDALISAGANEVSALDPRSGEALWTAEYNGYAGVTLPVVGAGLAFVTTGYGDGSLLAVRLNDGDQGEAGSIAWSTNRGAPIIPSPIVVGDELYMVSDNGVLSCLDAATGEPHWQERLAGNYAASLMFADGKLYLHNDRGQTLVAKPSTERFELLATNQLDSNIQATPACDGGELFLRTELSLYCLRVENGG